MEQRPDWMAFLSTFVDECKHMGQKFEKKEMTQQDVLDVAGEYFIRAHDYQEPRLHEAMRTAWVHIQEAMFKIVAEWKGENKLTKDELFRKHMGEIFLELWKLNDECIPIQTREYFRFVYEREAAIPWFH